MFLLVYKVQASMNVLASFDKIYIINLPERTDRLRSIERELGGLGSKVPLGNIVVFPAVRPAEPAGFPEIGWRGCFLSHLGILKKARGDGLSNVLILEDDALFTNAFLKSQKALSIAMRECEWDFLYLGHTISLQSNGGDCLVPYHGIILTTHCYAVNGRILERLILFLEEYAREVSRCRPVTDHGIDGVLSLFREKNRDIVTLISSPSLVTQSASRPNIVHVGADQLPEARGSIKWILAILPGGHVIADFLRYVKRSIFGLR
jgi:Glycosyltransferase family 25 (LPS biosynthesis protein)